MAITVTIVGANDLHLEERLRAAGMQVTSVSREGLQKLAHGGALAPDVVVVDLRLVRQMPPSLNLIKRHHPDTGLIVVASTLDPTLMLEAMRSGVTECVTDLDRGELEAAVKRLMSQRASSVAGSVFVFVGAKGGVGTTTAAVNIATALVKFGSTMIIDMHLAGGDAALFLGADTHFSVVDALENTHRLDASYFRGLLASTKAGPELLASADGAVAIPADPPRVRTLIDFAAHHYRHTVIDIPRSDAAILDSLESATKIIVVANQELATIRSAGRLASMLRQRYGRERIAVVLSRVDRQSEIGPEDVKSAIGGNVAASFPSDYRLAVKAINRGMPLLSESKTALAMAFRDFAAELAGPSPVKETVPERGSGLLGMLTGRR